MNIAQWDHFKQAFEQALENLAEEHGVSVSPQSLHLRLRDNDQTLSINLQVTAAGTNVLEAHFRATSKAYGLPESMLGREVQYLNRAVVIKGMKPRTDSIVIEDIGSKQFFRVDPVIFAQTVLNG